MILDAVASMVHLNTTLHDGEGMLVSVTSEIGEVRQIKEIIQKDLLASTTASEVEAEVEGDSGNPGLFDLDDREDEFQSVPDGDFESVQLGEAQPS